MTVVASRAGGQGSAPQVVSFVAGTSNVGRTRVIANLAVQLSLSGHRVLVVDCGGEGTPVDEYLQRLRLDDAVLAEALGPELESLLRLSVGGRHGAADSWVRRYAPGPGGIHVVGATDSLRSPRIGGGDPATPTSRLRDLLRAAPYDVVLLDYPPIEASTAVEDLVLLSDRVVLCFLTGSPAIAEAAELLRRIRQEAGEDLQLIAVASQFPEEDQQQADRVSAEISSRLGPVLRTDEVVKVPLQGYDEVLVTLLDDASATGPLPALEQLAALVTGGAVTALAPTPSTLRRRFSRWLAGPPAVGTAERIGLACLEGERPVATFIEEWLRPSGISADWLALDEPDLDLSTVDGLVVVLPAGGSISDRIVRAILARHQQSADRDTAPETLVIQVGGGSPVAIAGATTIDMSPGTALETASGRLFGALAIRGAARDVGRRISGAQLGGGPTHVNALPSREEGFTGRWAELATLRGELRDGEDETGVVLLSGATGTGTTALARRYVDCFRWDYKVIWWIPAFDRHSVEVALEELGRTLEIDPEGDPVGSTVRGLGEGDASSGGPWLLVFDGAEEAGVLDGLVPAGTAGHVLITTGVDGGPITAAGAPEPARVPLAPLPVADAVRCLRGAIVPLGDQPLPAAILEPLANAVGRLPANLRVAGAYLTAKVANTMPTVLPEDATVESAVESAASDLLVDLAGRPQEDAVARTVAALVDLLLRDPFGLAALRVAEFCVFLAPDGVKLELVRCPAMVAELAAVVEAEAPEAPSVPDYVDRILWTAVRFGLIRLVWSEKTLVSMPTAIRDALRERMTEAQREERRSQVRLALARTSGFHIDDKAMYAELRRHLEPCDALASDARPVRQWFIRQIMYLYRLGRPDAYRHAARLADTALARWRADERLRDDLTLMLAGRRADLHRMLGAYGEALELEEETQRRYAADLGRDHIRLLVLRRGMAGSLRGLGRYDEAFALDQATWRMFADTHGPDHPETLTAAHNLAMSSFLSGAVEEALRIESETRRLRVRIYGEDGERSLWSATDVGIYLRELGDFQTAVAILRDTQSRLEEVVGDFRNPLRLRVSRHLEIARRLAFPLQPSSQTIADIQRDYRDTLGPDHPLTWATAVSLAAAWHAEGKHLDARRIAAEALAYYERRLGEHPIVDVCRVNLAVYTYAVGDVVEARQESDLAYTGLDNRLGAPHPWTISAYTNHAAYVSGDPALARRVGELAYSLAMEYLGPKHPLRKVGAARLAGVDDPDALAGVDLVEITIPEI